MSSRRRDKGKDRRKTITLVMASVCKNALEVRFPDEIFSHLFC